MRKSLRDELKANKNWIMEQLKIQCIFFALMCEPRNNNSKNVCWKLTNELTKTKNIKNTEKKKKLAANEEFVFIRFSKYLYTFEMQTRKAAVL